MTDTAIHVENLSKLYRIGGRQNRHDTLRDKLTEVVTAPFRRLSSVFGHSYSVVRPRSSVVNSSVLSHRSSVVNSSVLGPRSSVPGPQSSVVFNDTIWALKDVSFSVKRGEVVGIIGRNGAGKTTLLKILSRITEPTEGQAEIHGRVSSLLEVGTGFHPELTGRENIYLNGAILGMKKAEIERKFDEIVAFSEIEKFINTPVKHYSSGMYVRLAFAVAAHMEPEILLVDEVLAVGDYEFQKKCLGKMEDVGREGRTVLFVSHNLGAIRRLCGRTILLSFGKIAENNITSVTIDKYISEGIQEKVPLHDIIRRIHLVSVFKINNIEIRQGVPSSSNGIRFVSNEDIEIEFDYEIYKAMKRFFVCFKLYDTDDTILIETFHNMDAEANFHPGSYISKAIIPANSLTPMIYELKIYFGIFGDRDFHKEPISVFFEVFSDGKTNMVFGMRPLSGKVALPIRWNTRRI